MPDIVVVPETRGKPRGRKKHKRTKARDTIDITEKGISLNLDPTWLPKEITKGGLDSELTEYLKPLFLSFRQTIKEKAEELVNRAEAGEDISDEQAWDEINEIHQEFSIKFEDALKTFIEEREIGGKSDRLAIVTGPPMIQTVKAINRPWAWKKDGKGNPVYKHREAGRGHLTLSFYHPPEMADVVEALWGHVNHFSPETVDVFLILLNRLACLPWHMGMASITLKEIAEYRGLKHGRDGVVWKLYDDLFADVKLLSDLCLSMTWEVDGETVVYGTEQFPARLFHITGLEYRGRYGIQKAFHVGAGEPLKSFLDGDKGGGRLVGYCSRELLKLNPYHDKLAKKIGVYWTLQAVVGASHGTFNRVKIKTILDHCGEALNSKKPGKSVKQVKAAFKKLVDIGLIPGIPRGLAPRNRRRGYFEKWLNQTIPVEVNPALCRLRGEEQRQLTAPDNEGDETHLSGQ